jgi:hypothetical protein
MAWIRKQRETNPRPIQARRIYPFANNREIPQRRIAGIVKLEANSRSVRSAGIGIPINDCDVSHDRIPQIAVPGANI